MYDVPGGVLRQPHTAVLNQKVWWQLYLVEAHTGTLVAPGSPSGH